MMNTSDANINNLISLWKTIGMHFDAYHNTSIFEYSSSKNIAWPSRLWYRQPISEDTIPKLKEKLATINSAVIIPVWENHTHNKLVLENNGFKKQFHQHGMVLRLRETFQVKHEMKIKRVTNVFEAEIWVSLFTKSFGYQIAVAIVIKTLQDVEYYIIYDQHQAIGSAILHVTDPVVGVHGVGVLPEMRRRGYAAQIMKLLINDTVSRGYEYMTLQASDMGKPLYLKLGFEFQFMLTNYGLD